MRKNDLKDGISLCMIVKNEQEFLAQCLESVKDVVDEIIIADSGSTDNTVEIAKNFDAKIFSFKWIDDFSNARNYSLDQAEYKWIFVLDADESISKRDHDKIIKAVKADIDAYIMVKRSYVDNATLRRFVQNDRKYPESEGYIGWCEEPNILLFRNDRKIYYEDIIHETVGSSIKRCRFKESALLDVPIHHYGRFDMSKKDKYYFEMCKKNAELKDNAHAWFNLGSHYDWFGMLNEAKESFEKSIGKNPEQTNSIFGLGLVSFKLGNFAEAEKCYRQYLQTEYDDLAVSQLIYMISRKGNHVEAHQIYDQSRKGFAVNREMGLVKLEQGMKIIAKNYFDKALAIVPNDTVSLELRSKCLNDK